MGTVDFRMWVNKTPIISTDVGIANEILSTKSIYNMNNFKEALPDIETAYNNSQKFVFQTDLLILESFY